MFNKMLSLYVTNKIVCFLIAPVVTMKALFHYPHKLSHGDRLRANLIMHSHSNVSLVRYSQTLFTERVRMEGPGYARLAYYQYVTSYLKEAPLLIQQEFVQITLHTQFWVTSHFLLHYSSQVLQVRAPLRIRDSELRGVQLPRVPHSGVYMVSCPLPNGA